MSHGREENVVGTFACTFVYVDNNPLERKTLWKDLAEISKKNLTLCELFLGDSKFIYNDSKKIGGAINRGPYKEDLNNLACEANVDDLKFEGDYYTWSN